MAALPTPAVGDVWGAQTNAAIESLHQTGTHTARDAISGSTLVTGTLWRCTTHNKVYRWTGSAWADWAKLVSDRLWVPSSGVTSIDEFDDASLDSNWVRVDSSGGASRAVWSEDADVLSAYNAGGDANSEMHALMRPLTSAGGAMAAGDAFLTCLTLFGSRYTNYTMGGIILADGVTYNAGTQVLNLNYINTAGQQSDLRPLTGYNTQPASPAIVITHNGVAQTPLFLRLVMLAANSWRLDVSPDGVSWIKGSSFARTCTPTHVGLYCTSWGTSTKGISTYQFLRRASGVS